MSRFARLFWGMNGPRFSVSLPFVLHCRACLHHARYFRLSSGINIVLGSLWWLNEFPCERKQKKELWDLHLQTLDYGTQTCCIPALLTMIVISAALQITQRRYDLIMVQLILIVSHHLLARPDFITMVSAPWLGHFDRFTFLSDDE